MPGIWNSLSAAVCHADNLHSFKCRLKSHFLKFAFSDWQCNAFQVQFCAWRALNHHLLLSDISVLKFISVSVSISFSLNHFYFYIISVLIWPIISVFISFYTNHFYFIIYQYCQKQSFQFQVVSTKLFFHIILQLQMVTAFISQH